MSRTGTDGLPDAQALIGAVTTLLGAPLVMAGTLVNAVGARGGAATGCGCGGSGCGCRIPAPCWEPRIVGTCCLVLGPQTEGHVRIDVENCGWDRHVVVLTALGKLAGWLTFAPTTLVLDPLERASFHVAVRPPQGLKPGQDLSGVILVRGCRDHAIKLDVQIRDCPGRTSCTVCIDDCADHVHHWYEHFYCPRPCRTATTGRDIDVRGEVFDAAGRVSNG